MTHSFIDGVLTLKNDKGEVAVFPHHPEQLRPWASEQEALDYVAGRQLYFAPPPTVDAQRPNKLFQINQQFEQAMQALVAQYPQLERESWPQQEKEARVWVDYLNATSGTTTAATTATAPATPLLDALAQARGVTKDQLAKTIIAKADAFAAAAGALIGKRQALEDQINAATTFAELEAIQW